MLLAAAETVAVGKAPSKSQRRRNRKLLRPPYERDVPPEPALTLHVGDEEGSLELAEEIGAPSVEPTWEPVGQGQPIPELATALAAEPVISELTQAEPESQLALIEPEGRIAAPIAGHRHGARRLRYSSSFVSKVISTGPTSLPYRTPPAMPNSNRPRTSPLRPSRIDASPTEAGHGAVQLTFSLEIASMQLTPTLKMSRLHLKPLSRFVSVRLGSLQDPQALMNHKVTFEIATIDLLNGTIGSVRLVPSALQSPAAAVHLLCDF